MKLTRTDIADLHLARSRILDALDDSQEEDIDLDVPYTTKDVRDSKASYYIREIIEHVAEYDSREIGLVMNEFIRHFLEVHALDDLLELFTGFSVPDLDSSFITTGALTSDILSYGDSEMLYMVKASDSFISVGTNCVIILLGSNNTLVLGDDSIAVILDSDGLHEQHDNQVILVSDSADNDQLVLSKHYVSIYTKQGK